MFSTYLALGSNLGDRHENIASAIARLREAPDIKVMKVSSLLENAAVGGPAGSPAFVNAAAEVETSLSPQALLERLLEIEREMGRVRRERWGPRVIDLDILLYGDHVIDQPHLRVPHPLMHERRFVLAPLAEIAPDAVHPIFKRTMTDLLAALQQSPHAP
ncbi:MAG TPA: 2-amino-4-hydroxy-6-hydroxymethyldihydropteridine diphosphokinase [Tepidisphaeraceae bacterium]|nr:2-amino-4-hydroxy-6-hydroxymethyldihydropteridine diphosphokinase [Tepidisphaeraceae bacterium]